MAGKENNSYSLKRNRLIDRRHFVMGAGLLAASGLLGMAGCSSGNSDSNSSSNSGSQSNDQGSASTASIEVTDQLGKTITFDSVPQRVCTTIIPFPSIYFAFMGNTDTLVGCNPASMPAYEKSTLKDMYPEMANINTDWTARNFSVNVEQLLALHPDVVFQWTTQPESIQSMEDAGLKVIALQYGTVDDLKTWLNIIGTMTQRQDRADFLSSYYDSQVAEVTDRLSGLSDADKPVAIHLADDLTVDGSGFTPYLLSTSGSDDPAATLQQQSAKVDMEQILTWNPEYIFIGNFTDIMPSDLMNNTLSGEDWSGVAAVQHNHVYKIPIGAYRWDPPSVESPLMIKWLSKIMHPDLFQDMDMKAEVTTFYQDVYDYQISDDQLSQMLDHTQE